MKKMTLTTALLLILIAAGTATAQEDSGWEGSKQKERKSSQTETTPIPVPTLSPLESERQNIMLKLLRKPPVPIKTPDKVLRVLFLPYIDENNVLHNYKYAYVKVEEGKWILGDYLMDPVQIDRKIIQPLDKAVDMYQNKTKGKKNSKKNEEE